MTNSNGSQDVKEEKKYTFLIIFLLGRWIFFQVDEYEDERKNKKVFLNIVLYFDSKKIYFIN